MLTVTSRRLLQAACQQARTIAASAQLLEEAAKNSKEALLSSWNDPNLDPPKFASDFLPQRDPAPAAIPEKLTVNFYMPHGVIMSGEKVDLAVFPAANGEMGVKPGHVSTIAELKPGLVTIHKEEDKQVEKYFVSSGFAFVYDDSVTDICAVEAVPLSDIDPAAVQSGLEEANAQLASAQTRGDDLGAAQAQIGVEVYTAMGAALTR